MTVTFHADLSDDISKVRQKIGDTDVATAQVQDETISAYLSTLGNVISTAIQLCYDLAAKWAKFGDVFLDDQRQLASKISERYIEIAQQLSAQQPPATVAGAAFSNVVVTGVGDCRGPTSPNCCDWPYSDTASTYNWS